MGLAEEYELQRLRLEPVLESILADIRAETVGDHLVDNVQGRVKLTPSFLAKAQRQRDGKPVFANPLTEIDDQVGVRVVVKFDAERPRLEAQLRRLFNVAEREAKEPEHDDQFGYEATHLLLFIPEDLVVTSKVPLPFFEAQVCTLFQHAWAEANHDVGYKPTATLTREQRRLKGAAAASAWAADRAFSELRENLEADPA